MTTRIGDSTWEYVEDRLVPPWVPWHASLFTIGNGHLGTRGSFEEGFADQEPATFIHGLFVTPPGRLPVLGAVPEWTGVAITVDGEPFRLDLRSPAGFERRLDLRTGVLTRTVVWRGADTGVLKAVFRRTASMDDPGLVALDVTFTAMTEPLIITLETGLDSTVAGPDGALWRTTAWDQIDATSLMLSARSIDDAHDLTVRCRVSGIEAATMVDDPRHPRLRATFTLDPGHRRTITKVVRYDVPGSQNRGLPEVSDLDDVVAASATHWGRRWAASRVDLDGDPPSELALRFAAFHLIAASPPREVAGSIGARLLSGYGYRHHVFWDTDIYVVPYLTVTQPDLALTHLRYRHRGLPGARRKAASHGRRGAFYAWEAADTGDEVTPLWGQMPNGEPIRIRTGEIQDHITACVAWATDHYRRWSGDDDFMRRRGVEMILDGAEYWASRLEVDDHGIGHIRDVIGPNEYHVHVDDSFFTNAMAAWQLRAAAAASEWLADAAPHTHRALLASLGIDSGEVARYRQVADHLAVHRRPDGVFEAHDGFFELEPVDLTAFQPSRASLQVLLGEKRAQEVQLVKQADVVMALVLLDEYRPSPETLAANFDYYAPKTDHGSSLSLAMHSLAASMIGRPAEAYDYFIRAVAIDHDDAMDRGWHGIHAATQGGLLQATLFGFGGLHLDGGSPRVEARLPEAWQSLGFSFVHHGVRHERLVAQDTRRRN